VPPNYATSLAWIVASQLPDLTYLVGSSQVLLDSPLNNVTPIDADIKYSFALGATTPTFITLVPQGTGRPKISIYTASTADTGVYSVNFILTEVFSNLVITDTFIVTVSCVQTISAPASISPVVYYISDP
jgi:hypothetical protein